MLQQLHIHYTNKFYLQQVLDENGQDVTPLPLSQIDTNTLRKNQTNIVADSSAATVSKSILILRSNVYY